MPVWCTNRSLPPSSGVMNPKPFASLNHFTVPFAIALTPQAACIRASPRVPIFCLLSECASRDGRAKSCVRHYFAPPSGLSGTAFQGQLDAELGAHFGGRQLDDPAVP